LFLVRNMFFSLRVMINDLSRKLHDFNPLAPPNLLRKTISLREQSSVVLRKSLRERVSPRGDFQGITADNGITSA